MTYARVNLIDNSYL